MMLAWPPDVGKLRGPVRPCCVDISDRQSTRPAHHMDYLVVEIDRRRGLKDGDGTVSCL